MRAWALLLILGMSTPAAVAQDAPRQHALIIGINKYWAEMEHVPRLKYAVSDAVELDKRLEELGWDARLLREEDATREKIVMELVRLAQQTQPRDTVLIYFAGHGVREKLGSTHTYWLTYSTSLDMLPVQGLRLSHVIDYIKDIPAERKLVLLDHCFSGDIERLALDAPGGGGRDGSGGVVLTPRNLFPLDDFTEEIDARKPRGLVVLGAALSQAFEFPELGHGLFTYGFLQALIKPGADKNGDNTLSVQEVWAFANETVKKIAHDKGITQTAIEVMTGTDLSEWKLFPSPRDLRNDAEDMRRIVDLIDSHESLSATVRAITLQAISNWENALRASLAPNEVDLKVITELQEIRGLGTEIGWNVRAEMLRGKLRALGLLHDP